jgi:hypothetical protein
MGKLTNVAKFVGVSSREGGPGSSVGIATD